MKKAFAILGALLVVAMGFLMPHIAAAYQDRSLEGDVWEKENAAVSLELAEEIVELQDFDLLETLDLCAHMLGGPALEAGRNTSAAGALRIANELVKYMVLDTFFDIQDVLPMDEAIPLLVTDSNGRSGIMWQCIWTEDPHQSVWIDDEHGNLAGFCLRADNPLPLEIVCSVICEKFLPPYLEHEVFTTDDGYYWIRLTSDSGTIDLPVSYEYENGIPSRLYLCFNMKIQYINLQSAIDKASAELSGEASPEG